MKKTLKFYFGVFFIDKFNVTTTSLIWCNMLLYKMDKIVVIPKILREAQNDVKIIAFPFFHNFIFL